MDARTIAAATVFSGGTIVLDDGDGHFDNDVHYHLHHRKSRSFSSLPFLEEVWMDVELILTMGGTPLLVLYYVFLYLG
jgi:hypothetical protein